MKYSLTTSDFDFTFSNIKNEKNMEGSQQNSNQKKMKLSILTKKSLNSSYIEKRNLNQEDFNLLKNNLNIEKDRNPKNLKINNILENRMYTKKMSIIFGNRTSSKDNSPKSPKSSKSPKRGKSLFM